MSDHILNCNECLILLDDVIDEYATDEQEKACWSHFQDCSGCASALQRRMEVKSALKNLHSLDKPAPELATKILRAREALNTSGSRLWRQGGLAAALAASVFFGIMIVLISQPSEGPSPVATSRIEKTIKVVFQAEQALDNVTFSLILPPHVKLQGHLKKANVQWTGSLRRGRNLMTLPLVATNANEGRIFMEIIHGSERKRFEVPMGSYKSNETSYLDSATLTS